MLSRYLYFSVLAALIVLHLHVSTDWSKWKWAALYVYSIRNYFLKLTAFFFFFFSNARVEIQWGPFFLLVGANSASQLSTWNIWITRQISSTCAFDKVHHQGAIRVCLGARDELRISINTDEFFLVFVCVVRSHQIPMILLGTSRWTVIPSGHHQHWATWVDIADGTRSIVVLEIFVKRVKRQFVLSAIYQSSERRPCTDRTLGSLEGKGSSLRLHCGCKTPQPWFLSGN